MYLKLAVRILFISCLIGIVLPVSGQNNSPKKWKRDTIIGNQVFKEYSNWLSGGAGIARNGNFASNQFAGGIDYNFHIQKEYFQMGILLTGDTYGDYSNYEGHICYGNRIETTKYNLSFWAGVSGSNFFVWDPVAQLYNQYFMPGLYGDIEYIYKVTYDVGVGISGFADFNQKQNVAGVKFSLFFCGSYKGTKQDLY